MNDALSFSAVAPSNKIKPAVTLPRLGFVGLGRIGRLRLEALALSGVAELSAVADPVDETLRAASEIAPRAIAANNLDELLNLDLDGIVIATPSALHAEQTIAALNHGCAVFCQKPLARTAAETCEVVNKAREVDRLLGVDLSYRHTAGMKAIRQLIRAGQLGEVYAIELVFHNAYGPDKPWFYDAKLSGGGCLIDLGTHLIDLALWCLGFPDVERASGSLLVSGARLRSESGSAQVEDYAAAQVQLSNGAVIQFTCSWKAPAGCDARIEATFFGTKGGASFSNVNGSFYDFRAEQLFPDRTCKVLAMPPDDWGGRAVIAWANQLATSPEFDPEIQTIASVAATIDAIYKSCA